MLSNRSCKLAHAFLSVISKSFLRFLTLLWLQLKAAGKKQQALTGASWKTVWWVGRRIIFLISSRRSCQLVCTYFSWIAVTPRLEKSGVWQIWCKSRYLFQTQLQKQLWPLPEPSNTKQTEQPDYQWGGKKGGRKETAVGTVMRDTFNEVWCLVSLRSFITQEDVFSRGKAAL